MLKNLRRNLVLQIIVGIVLGMLLALFLPETAGSMSLLGDLFINALKAIAPILVFTLIISAIATQKLENETHLKSIIGLYIVGTLCAAIVAVVLSFLFPITLTLSAGPSDIVPPQNLQEVINTFVFNIVDNPVHAILDSNYIGILAWAGGLGLALRFASESTKNMLKELSDAVSKIVIFIIQFAPIGIFGIVASTIADTGFSELAKYGKLAGLLVSAMLIMAFVVNPIIVYFKTFRNPYPLILECIKVSGVTAFFMRSSAANIPVNMALCEKLKLDEDTYSVSIPLGATINMSGAAITISILTLAAVHTFNIPVDPFQAFLLCVVSAVSACGAGGVAGGSLMLIPLSCSLFGISNDVAWKIIGVGYTISVIQDSLETALNSSTDVIFTAAACRRAENKTVS